MPKRAAMNQPPGETPGSATNDDLREEAAQRSLLDDSDVAAGSERCERDERAVRHAASWRPTWLRPGVLSTFALLFLLSSVGLPTMLWYSNKHDGLVETRQSFVYLWRFGPTGVITVISLLWSRVEMQALRYMPWIAHRYEQLPANDGNTYDLDYTSMLPHSILVQSLRRRHHLVFLATVASLVLKVQIVLAPGLYSLASTRSTKPAEVHLLDSFNVIDGDLPTLGTSTYYLAQALHSYDMRYPFGLTENEAYQTFRAGNGTSRGTVDNPLEVTVGSYFPETKCLKLESFSDSKLSDSYYQTYELQLKFEGCDQPVFSREHFLLDKDTAEHQQPSINHWVGNKTLNPLRPCDNLPQESNQTLYYVARYDKVPEDEKHRVLRDVAAVLCSSMSWLSRVKIADDGVNPVVTQIPNEDRTPMPMNLWYAISNSMPDSIGPWEGDEIQRVWGPVNAAFVFRGMTAGSDNSNLSTIPPKFTTDELYESTMEMSRILGPAVGHSRLRQAGNSETAVVGSTAVGIDRLLVNKRVCLSMTALFVLLTGIAFLIILWHSKMTRVWFRDPATILGSLIFFRDYPDVMRRLTAYVSQGTNEAVDWSRCNFTPLVLETWVRAVFTLLVCVVVAALAYSVRLSETSQGLATVDDQGYIHLLWTSIPALVMLSIALYVSACSSAYRSRSILSLLSQRQMSAEDLDISFSDMLETRVLALALLKRLGALSLAQFLAIFCGFLTTLVSVIFVVETIPKPRSIQLQQENWFGSRELGDYDVMRNRRRVLSSLILYLGDATLNFPRNTYDDLVFPSLEGEEMLNPRANTSIHVNIPAARIDGACFRMPPDTWSVYAVHASKGDNFAIRPTITESITCPNGSRVDIQNQFEQSEGHKHEGRVYVAEMIKSPGNERDINYDCGLGLNSTADFKYSTSRSQTYAWGEYSLAKNAFRYLTLWRCNYTWTEVPTDVSLVAVDGEYVLDPENPPRPDLPNARLWDPPFDVPQLETADVGARSDGTYLSDSFPQVRMTNALAGYMQEQFQVLVQPNGPFEMEAFGDESKEVDIMRSLQHNYGFLTAQLANMELRLNITEDSRTGPAPPGGLPALAATMTDRGRRRLVQIPKLTYIIIAILVLVVLANVWLLLSAASRRLVGRTWVLDPDVKRVAPDNFNSISSMAALLRNSNVPNYLPESPELLSKKEFYGRLSNVGFRMGWFQDEKAQVEHFTVGATGDDDYKFVSGRKHVDRS